MTSPLVDVIVTRHTGGELVAMANANDTLGDVTHAIEVAYAAARAAVGSTYYYEQDLRWVATHATAGTFDLAVVDLEIAAIHPRK